MKKSLAIALMGATVLGLVSCKGSGNKFTEDELGMMNGHFIGEKYELDLSTKDSTLVNVSDGSNEKLTITEIKKEKYTSTTLKDAPEFDVDYMYLKGKGKSPLQYRVSIPKEEYASLKLEKLDNDEWVTDDNLYFFAEDYVGTWATTKDTAGFIQPAVFTDEFIYPIENSNLKLPSGHAFYMNTVWYPQFATYKVEEETIETQEGETSGTQTEKKEKYVTELQVLLYDQDDLTSPFTYYALRSSSNKKYSSAMWDVSYGIEYYYPSDEYYKGDWYTKDGKLTISAGEKEGELVYNGETYTSEVKRDKGYGWTTYLQKDGKTLKLRPSFLGGFTAEPSTGETIEAVAYNPSALEATWLYGKKSIQVFTDYDSDFNEILKVKVNGNEVTPTFVARNKKFAIQFNLDGEQAYLYSKHSKTVAVLSAGDKETYVCAREVYDKYFVNVGNLYSSDSVGTPLPLIENKLDTLVIHDDFTATYNNTAYDVNYGYDEVMNAVSVSFNYSDQLTYTLYVFDTGVYILDKGGENNDYAVFASEDYLSQFVADWTKRGAKATLLIDEKYNVTLDGNRSPVGFDFDTELGFFMYFLGNNNTALYILNLDSAGTLILTKYGYQGNELAVLGSDWYIKVEDYNKIKGTYVYVSDIEKEYVIVGDDETVQITTFIDEENVLKDYSGENIRYSYFGEKVCLAFRFEERNMWIYIYLDGINVVFFDSLYYIQEVLMNNQGYFTDGTNVLSIGGQAVYYNGTQATIQSAQGNQIVFMVSGTTYTATFENGVATLKEGENTLTLNKGTFDLKDYAGEWTVNGAKYSLTVKENKDGSLKYEFTCENKTYTDYEVSIKDGKTVVTFYDLTSKYVITIGEDGTTSLTIESSIPLPPPPPPAPLA